MTPILVPRPAFWRYSAAATPWPGSVKHIWNALSLPAVTSGEEAEGVSWKYRSAKVSEATATQGAVVVQP